MQVGQNGKIEIKSYADDEDWLTLEFCDSGNSLPSEYIEKALDPFKDLENGSEINLGLTVSIQMIKDLGGDIKFDSSKKPGNKIIIKIPTYKYHKKNQTEKAVISG